MREEDLRRGKRCQQQLFAPTHVLVHSVRVDEVGQQVAAPQEENFAQHVGNQAAAQGWEGQRSHEEECEGQRGCNKN